MNAYVLVCKNVCECVCVCVVCLLKRAARASVAVPWLGVPNRWLERISWALAATLEGQRKAPGWKGTSNSKKDITFKIWVCHLAMVPFFFIVLKGNNRKTILRVPLFWKTVCTPHPISDSFRFLGHDLAVCHSKVFSDVRLQMLEVRLGTWSHEPERLTRVYSKPEDPKAFCGELIQDVAHFRQ